MIKTQLISRGIHSENVLNAMREVDRHLFVPEAMRQYAYEDGPIPIGFQQTISQPYIVAFMTQALQLEPDHKVLEIGTGSGYQAAILSRIVNEVYTIEIVPELFEKTTALFKKLGYDNIHARLGDGYSGWPEKAPFDRIILTAAPEKIPEPLLEQLALGGKLIAPVGGASQKLILLEKKERDHFEETFLLPVRFVPMTGKTQS